MDGDPSFNSCSVILSTDLSAIALATAEALCEGWTNQSDKFFL